MRKRKGPGPESSGGGQSVVPRVKHPRASQQTVKADKSSDSQPTTAEETSIMQDIRTLASLPSYSTEKLSAEEEAELSAMTRGSSNIHAHAWPGGGAKVPYNTTQLEAKP